MALSRNNVLIGGGVAALSALIYLRFRPVESEQVESGEPLPVARASHSGDSMIPPSGYSNYLNGQPYGVAQPSKKPSPFYDVNAKVRDPRAFTAPVWGSQFAEPVAYNAAGTPFVTNPEIEASTPATNWQEDMLYQMDNPEPAPETSPYAGPVKNPDSPTSTIHYSTLNNPYMKAAA